MRTLLICHHDAPLDREGLVRWLGSFSTYVGTLVIREPHSRMRRRIRREIGRVGFGRFLDVLAFRAYYGLMRARADRQWEQQQLEHLRTRFPEHPGAPELVARSPNAPEADAFIRESGPDLMIARCKALLQECMFSIPRLGTYAMHPGICPEYRNAHGCFWALANGDRERVGMTLLRIDRGVDTGPVYGYFHIDPDSIGESHVLIQHRAVLDHLDAIQNRLKAIERGDAVPLDTAGRRSAAWGQPWLTAYLRMRWMRDTGRFVRSGRLVGRYGGAPIGEGVSAGMAPETSARIGRTAPAHGSIERLIPEGK